MRTYYPPKVAFRRPRLETVLAFLESNGWTVMKRTGRFILVKHPEETMSYEEGGYHYHVPAHIKEGYNDEAAFLMVETFSEIFDIPLQELFDLLAMDLDEIKEKQAKTPYLVNMQKAILAQAS